MAERTSGDHGAIAYWACCQGTALKSHLAHGPHPYKDDLQKTVSRLHGNICSSKALVLFLLENHSLWSRWAPRASGREALMQASKRGWTTHLLPSWLSPPPSSTHKACQPLSSGQQPASHCFRPFALWPHPVAHSSFHFLKHSQPSLGLVPNSLPPKDLPRWTCWAHYPGSLGPDPDQRTTHFQLQGTLLPTQ